MILDLVRKPDYDRYNTPEWAFHIVARCPYCDQELAQVEAGEEASIELENHVWPPERTAAPPAPQGHPAN